MPSKKTERRFVNAVFDLNLNEMKPIDLNGRAVYRVSARTLPDDIIMNRVLYPAAEIAKGYKTLNNRPAPLGHPRVGDWNVSANDPEGINRHWCGAWNADSDRVLEGNGKYRIHHNIYLDIEKAKESDNGRRVLNAFEKGDQIHTSVGVMCNAEWSRDNEDYDWIARNIAIDHNAILLDQRGAATPDEGVGVFVSEAFPEEKELIINNFRYKESSNGELPATPSNPNPESTPMPNENPESKPAATPEAKPETITMTNEQLKDIVRSAVSEELAKHQEANAATEKAEIVNKIVATNLLSKENAEKLDIATLKELHTNAGTKQPAAPVNGAPATPDTNDGKITLENMFKDYSYNAIAEEVDKRHRPN